MHSTHKPQRAPGRLLARFPSRSGLLRHSAAWFLGSLALLIITAPFLQALALGKGIESVLVTILLTAAVLAVGGRRRVLAVAAVLATPVLTSRWLHHMVPDHIPHTVYVVSLLVFLAFVVVQFLRFILRAPKVNSEVLCAAVSTYLLLGLWWATAYALVARLAPEAFAGATGATRMLQDYDAVYFSFITLTTVGYGDITPVSATARMLAVAEAITGTMYMAVLVARLVSVYTVEASNPTAEQGNPP